MASPFVFVLLIFKTSYKAEEVFDVISI